MLLFNDYNIFEKKYIYKGLEELCAVKLGAMEARVRTAGVPWEEVMQRNKSGEVLIVLDMMVFDVTRWLPYHPGGAAIIPKQVCNRSFFHPII